MKKLYIMILVSLYTALASAQSLQTLKNGRYQYLSFQTGSTPAESFLATVGEWLYGDSLINGSTYRVCYSHVLFTQPQAPEYIPDSNTHFGYQVFFLREAGGVVYRYDTTAQTEYKIIDYNMNPGDTLNFPEMYTDEVQKPVLGSIQTLTFMGVQRRVFTFSDAVSTQQPLVEKNIVWIEGIGSIKGWQMAAYPMLTDDWGPRLKLSCAYDSLTQIYDSPDHDSCFYSYESTANVSVEEAESVSVQVYPNPAAETLYINAGPLPVKSIEIFDLQGRRLAAHAAQNGELQAVPVAFLSPGIYVVKIHAAQSHTKTFIVSR
ncbi:MAG: T9SS type A sorting domain-containing protein [Bacteroidia bacterium]|nr:T9SS type A sorting domain-containing protein [Bacteroidia bacterium]